MLDHSAPPEIPFRNYGYFLQQLREIQREVTSPAGELHKWDGKSPSPHTLRQSGCALLPSSPSYSLITLTYLSSLKGAILVNLQDLGLYKLTHNLMNIAAKAPSGIVCFSLTSPATTV